MTKASLVNKRWRENHPEQWAAIQKRSYLKRKAKSGYLDEVLARHRLVCGMIQEFLRALKETYPCADCGRKDFHYTMEWDHIKTKQRPSPGSCRGFPELWRELALCELVCCRCHRIRTWKRRAA